MTKGLQGLIYNGSQISAKCSIKGRACDNWLQMQEGCKHQGKWCPGWELWVEIKKRLNIRNITESEMEVTGAILHKRFKTVLQKNSGKYMLEYIFFPIAGGRGETRRPNTGVIFYLIFSLISVNPSASSYFSMEFVCGSSPPGRT